MNTILPPNSKTTFSTNSSSLELCIPDIGIAWHLLFGWWVPWVLMLQLPKSFFLLLHVTYADSGFCQWLHTSSPPIRTAEESWGKYSKTSPWLCATGLTGSGRAQKLRRHIEKKKHMGSHDIGSWGTHQQIQGICPGCPVLAAPMAGVDHQVHY